MKKGHKILFGSLGALILGIGLTFSFNAFKNGFSILPTRAETYSSKTITFDSNSFVSKSGTTITLRTTTFTGGPIIAKLYGAKDKVNNSIGTVGENTQLRFYEADGTTEYTFEDLDVLRFYHAGTSISYDLHARYTDGTYLDKSFTGSSTNPRGISFTTLKNVSNIQITFTNQMTNALSKMVIEYNCTSKHQTGISVTTSPTKTTYEYGDYFDPTGMVVCATYSNNTSVVTEAYSYTTRALTDADEYVVVSHNGFSTQVPVTVNPMATGLSGQYIFSNYAVTMTLNFTSNNTGTYSGSNLSLNFTYSMSGTSITLVYVSGSANSDFSGYRLFAGDDSPTPNTTGVVVSSSQIQIKTYNNFGTATTRTFTKS